MGRFIMVAVFGLACCWTAYHFWPGSAGAVHAEGHAIPIMALIAIGGLVTGYKLSGK